VTLIDDPPLPMLIKLGYLELPEFHRLRRSSAGRRRDQSDARFRCVAEIAPLMPTDAALNQFLDLLRFGSISTDSKYKDQILGCADWLKNKLTAIGLEAKLHEMQGHPILVAHGPKKKGRPTVLLYGHYDVQPVDPLDLWHRPPFNPGIENGTVTARGASDNKGQIFAHILGIEQTMKEKGDLPVNLIVLIEGEEEIGSRISRHFSTRIARRWPAMSWPFPIRRWSRQGSRPLPTVCADSPRLRFL